MSAALQLRDVHKSFGATHVLDGVGFTVPPGTMFGFCGSNGAGKTTTMRIAMGLVRADAGTVRWQGRPLDQEIRRRVGPSAVTRATLLHRDVGLSHWLFPDESPDA